ncbi:choice-of-anchor tandem repeat GloVer-containing protein [Chryseolinea lacunae]|uniref:T9SS type A sorting domain-containing protein n=1 Tax=Chryseolinea lacunae TaxID=2801331 RepID=A0ABS1KKY2_9BACT|nr:choice-of-anchor tandem repeat GloVer-containing protein [Chryseolinea lacunae]MBL0739887.1 T9SS type A sorting domain-containing protein [Chryseolinea lacunae]
MRKALLSLLLVFSIAVTHAQKQFWGTTSSGGAHQNGFIFKTDSIGNNLEIIHSFESAVDGENIGALLLASNNKLYGLAASGGRPGAGAFGGGTFFEYDLDTDRFRVVARFGPDNTNFPNVFTPRAEGVPGLTEVSPGLLYGLLQQGQYVFSYNINTGVFGHPFDLPLYQGGTTNSTLHNRLAEAFYKAADGNLYAASPTNSSCPIPNPNMGSIIQVKPATNALTIRHKSSCLVDAGFIYNGRFAEVSGKLYSTTQLGGVNNKGVIFEYNIAANTYTKLHDFAGGVYAYEPSSLVVGKNGKLYGTAHGGGVPEPNLPSGGGILYEFDLTTNTFVNKHNFLIENSWVGGMGTFPSGLVASTNGKIYGVTEFGVFEYNTVTEEARVAGRFNDRGFAPSLLQVCRKPAYQYPAALTYDICKDAAFSLDLSSTNATSVTWKHNGVLDASRTTTLLSIPSFDADDAGTWQCTLTNECGTTVAQTITLSLNQPSQPAITPSGPTTFCAGENVTLSAPDGFHEYAWSNGETTRAIEVSESGAFSVIVSNGCESPASNVTTVTVNALPAAPVKIEAPSFNILKAIGTSASYAWTLNDVLLNAHTAEINVTQSGTYTVRGISADGCLSSGFASLSFIVTAMEVDAKDAVVVYPNPSRGVVHVQVSNNLRGQAEVSVFDTMGSLVFSQGVRFDDEASTINLEGLPSGLYHLMLRKGENLVLKKIVLR